MSECRIHQLDNVVVDQIAAGEVVERPASVVKELVENALDAGADEISVVIEQGGRSRLEVIDNGHGMNREDAKLAIQRFATSKIESARDLLTISTLGFRGEALSSIASISKFKLSTRNVEGGEIGAVLTVEGGELKSIQDSAMPLGTRIEVKHLFYNVPARKKFLKSERAETGAVKALMMDFSSGYPNVRFRLVADGKESLVTGRAEDFFTRAKDLSLAGKEPFPFEDKIATGSGFINVQGLLSRPVEAVAGPGRLRLIINGRVVRDKVLLRAVREGFGTFLKPGQYPRGVLSVNLPPEQIDVNVHPQKSEVRFRSSGDVFTSVAKTIRSALGDISPRGEEGARMHSVSSMLESVEGRGSSHFHFTPTASSAVDGSGRNDNTENIFSAGVLPPKKDRPLSGARFIGQLFDCYLLLQDSESFVIVDMHAAHERITFARFKEHYANGELKSQALLIPETINLPADKLEMFKKAQGFLSKVGLECEIFGEDAVIVRQVPILLKEAAVKQMLEDILSLPEWGSWESLVEERLDMAFSRLACHGSIRSGRQLEREEVYALLNDMDDVAQGGFCPHGRPVAKEFSKSDIEMMFGRIM